MFVTFAPDGPCLQNAISVCTLSFSPSNIASTLLSGKLRTQPFTSWWSALCLVSDLKNTPWTLPVTNMCALVFMVFACVVGV